jgi:DNA polymerase-3 subunit epsilon
MMTEQSVIGISSSVSRTFRSPRPHTASEEELARHADFMAGFSEPIWSR